MLYKIIQSGSSGNCTVLNNTIAIDLGISWKALGEFQKTIQLVLLTHIHSDHFNITTIKRLHKERPTVKFVCLKHLVEPLFKVVGIDSIYVLDVNKLYDLGICKVAAFPLKHDVPNNGWRVMIGKEKAIYATDTCNLYGISAKNYDLYLIEANYDLPDVLRKINEKRKNGEYVYEIRAVNNHLSIQQAHDFIDSNMGPNGMWEPMHQHKEKDNGKVEVNNPGTS